MQGNHAGHQLIHIISFNIHALTGTHTTPHTHTAKFQKESTGVLFALELHKSRHIYR